VLYAGIAASAAPASAFDFKISDTAWSLIDNDWYGSYAFGRADDKGFFGRGLTTGTFNFRLSNGTTIGASGSVEYFSNLAEAEAVQLANDTPFGLAAYLFSQNLSRAWRVAEQLDAGMVGVNEGIFSNEVVPFGGNKESGLCREGGAEGLDEYLETKYICLGALDA
jgi:succinate-semialdehyde dehydrogenase/glutarate-semialdehyde dehydrogenase